MSNQFKVAGSFLYEAVMSVKPAVLCNNLHLNKVKLSVRDEKVWLSATDLDLYVTTQIKRASSSDTFDATIGWVSLLGTAIPMKKSSSVTFTFPEENEGFIEVTDGDFRLQFKVHEEDAKFAFPVAPLVDGGHGGEVFELNLPALREVLPFASQDDGRSVILQGVYVGDDAYAATDSYRIGEVSVPSQAPSRPIIIHGDTAKFIVNNFAGQTVSATVDEGRRLIYVGSSSMFVTGRLIAGDFPNYKNLFPTQAMESSMNLGEGMMEGLLRAVQASQSLGFHRSTPVVINPSVDGQTELVLTQDGTIVTPVVKGEVKEKVAFGPKFLVEFFAGTNVDTLFGSGLKPWGISEDAPEIAFGAARRRLIMPVRYT